MAKKYKVLITNPAPMGCRCENPTFSGFWEPPMEESGFYSAAYSRWAGSAVRRYQISLGNGFSFTFGFNDGAPQAALFVHKMTEEVWRGAVTPDILGKWLYDAAMRERDEDEDYLDEEYLENFAPGFLAIGENEPQGFYLVFDNGYAAGARWDDSADVEYPGESWNPDAETYLWNPDLRDRGPDSEDERGQQIQIGDNLYRGRTSPEAFAAMVDWARTLGTPEEELRPGQREVSTYFRTAYEAPFVPSRLRTTPTGERRPMPRTGAYEPGTLPAPMVGGGFVSSPSELQGGVSQTLTEEDLQRMAKEWAEITSRYDPRDPGGYERGRRERARLLKQLRTNPIQRAISERQLRNRRRR
jgi:hypothetical protein